MPDVVLPASLPLDAKGLQAFAALLGVSMNASTMTTARLAEAGPYRLGGSCDAPAVLMTRHLAADAEPVEAYGNQLDMRTFIPFSGLEFLGADFSGDGLYLDPRRRTRASQAPVIRLCHDESLTAELEANGLHEFAARGLLQRWAVSRDLMATPGVKLLLATKVTLAPGKVAEKHERAAEPAETTAPTRVKTAKTPVSKTTPAKTAPASKTPTKKTVAKKTVAKKTSAKKTSAKKTSAKKTVAKKIAKKIAKKPTAKIAKTTAKKAVKKAAKKRR